MGELRHLVGRRLLVQIDDGSTIAGHLAIAGKTTLHLEGAVALAGDQETPIDGEVIVMLARVTWMQAV